MVRIGIPAPLVSALFLLPLLEDLKDLMVNSQAVARSGLALGLPCFRGLLTFLLLLHEYWGLRLTQRYWFHLPLPLHGQGSWTLGYLQFWPQCRLHFRLGRYLRPRFWRCPLSLGHWRV